MTSGVTVEGTPGDAGRAPGEAGRATDRDRLEKTSDLNVVQTVPLVCPRDVRKELPMEPATNHTVVDGRRELEAILSGADDRLFVAVGPCSIHDEDAALEYARRLRELAGALSDRLFVVMRVYFEKPRTALGWKGLISDPHLDGSDDMNAGLRLARHLLLEIGRMGLPAGTEFLDPITPQYIADLITWGTIGARTTESQTHRQMASGLSMPIGYKNSTEGNLQVALDAMRSAASPHSFLGVGDDGRTAIIKTRGNRWAHLVLRGGRGRPNYDPQSVAEAAAAMEAAGLRPLIMVDCSHANSRKKLQNQEVVFRSVVEQRAAGNRDLIGLLLESHLHEGSQPFPLPGTELKYGVSITDECIGWAETETLLRFAHQNC